MKTKTPTEHEEQAELFSRLKPYPEFNLFYAIPNGARVAITVAKRLKKEGLKAGMPDTCFPVPRLGYHSLYIEMKRLKPRGTVEPHQRAWLEGLAGEGHLCYVCWGWRSAWEILTRYIENKLVLGVENAERIN